jgi:hypothetical protein
MRAVRRNDDESHGAGRGIVPWPHGRDPCARRVRHGGDVFCAVTVRQRGIMGISSRGAPASSAPETLTFDRKSGRLAGANLLDRATVLALQAGSVATGPFGHRGYGLGCRLIGSVAAHREIVVRLNEDATFAMPFCDAYWSRLLNCSYDYEEEINALLHCAREERYEFVDCRANFGYWSVLASSQPFGAQQALAIEAGGLNVKRLNRNAELNGNRFRAFTPRSQVGADSRESRGQVTRSSKPCR